MHLTPVDVATGLLFGGTRQRLPNGHAPSPAAALEAAVRPALEHGHCYVSFSGGKDSSAVLATAAAVARRESLPAPVPVSIRAPDAAESDESEWQESVIAHLGLDDWIRIEVEDELDALGSYALRGLERHGLLWPFNAHFHAPMLEHAAGATLLTGIGGDELWNWSCVEPVSMRRRLAQLAPPPLRRTALARRIPVSFPWLRPRGLRAVRHAAAGESMALPRTVRGRLERARGRRYLTSGTAALDLLAADAGATIAHPLLDPPLWSSVAATAPRAGFARPADALAATAGHLVPADLVTRRTKATFDSVFFREHSRQFARQWTGGGVPLELVDEAALREHWLHERNPDGHSLTLMQAAWCESVRRDRVDEARSRVAQ